MRSRNRSRSLEAHGDVTLSEASLPRVLSWPVLDSAGREFPFDREDEEDDTAMVLDCTEPDVKIWNESQAAPLFPSLGPDPGNVRFAAFLVAAWDALQLEQERLRKREERLESLESWARHVERELHTHSPQAVTDLVSQMKEDRSRPSSAPHVYCNTRLKGTPSSPSYGPDVTSVKAKPVGLPVLQTTPSEAAYEAGRAEELATAIRRISATSSDDDVTMQERRTSKSSKSSEPDLIDWKQVRKSEGIVDQPLQNIVKRETSASSQIDEKDPLPIDLLPLGQRQSDTRIPHKKAESPKKVRQEVNLQQAPEKVKPALVQKEVHLQQSPKKSVEKFPKQKSPEAKDQIQLLPLGPSPSEERLAKVPDKKVESPKKVRQEVNLQQAPEKVEPPLVQKEVHFQKAPEKVEPPLVQELEKVEVLQPQVEPQEQTGISRHFSDREVDLSVTSDTESLAAVRVQVGLVVEPIESEPIKVPLPSENIDSSSQTDSPDAVQPTAQSELVATEKSAPAFSCTEEVPDVVQPATQSEVVAEELVVNEEAKPLVMPKSMMATSDAWLPRSMSPDGDRQPVSPCGDLDSRVAGTGGADSPRTPPGTGGTGGMHHTETDWERGKNFLTELVGAASSEATLRQLIDQAKLDPADLKSALEKACLLVDKDSLAHENMMAASSEERNNNSAYSSFDRVDHYMPQPSSRPASSGRPGRRNRSQPSHVTIQALFTPVLKTANHVERKPKPTTPRQRPSTPDVYTARFKDARHGTAQVYSDVSILENERILTRPHRAPPSSPLTTTLASQPQPPPAQTDIQQSYVHPMVPFQTSPVAPQSAAGSAGCSLGTMHLITSASPFEKRVNTGQSNVKPVRQRLGY